MSNGVDNNKKVLNVPNLRFPEFKENYCSKCFTETLIFLNSNSFSRDMMNYEFGYYKNIHYGDILIKLPTLVDCDNIKLPFLNNDIFVPKKMNLLKSGDIVIADTAEDYTAGKTIEIKNKSSKVLSGLHTISCRPTIGFYNGYLGYYLNSFSFRRNLLPLIQGIKVYSVSKYMFDSLFIKYPCIKEQEKVTNLLINIDARIETQNKIIEDINILKKKLNDDFFDSIKVKIKFTEIYKKASEGGTPDTSNLEYYKDGTIPFAKIENLNNKYLISCNTKITQEGLKNSSAWIVPKESVLLSNGATIGEATITKIDVATKQGILGIVPKSHYSAEDLYYLFKSKKFRKTMKRITTKGTMDAAYLKDLNNEYIYISIDEKFKRHIELMQMLDIKVENETSIKRKYELEKTYLLKNLFI